MKRQVTRLQEIQLAEGGDDEPVGCPTPAVYGLDHCVENGPHDLRVFHVYVQAHARLGQRLLLQHLLEGQHVVP